MKLLYEPAPVFFLPVVKTDARRYPVKTAVKLGIQRRP